MLVHGTQSAQLIGNRSRSFKYAPERQLRVSKYPRRILQRTVSIQMLAARSLVDLDIDLNFSRQLPGKLTARFGIPRSQVFADWYLLLRAWRLPIATLKLDAAEIGELE